MFAFSIWDKKRKTLYLARDRFGKKPLSYSKSENTVAFSSDLRSLREIADAGNVDKVALESLLDLGLSMNLLLFMKILKKFLRVVF